MPVSSGLGIDVWIEVEGKRLEEFQEYVDISGGERRIVCWVPCELGKEFTLGCSLPPERVNEANYTVKIHLDGYRIGLSRNSFEKDIEEGDDMTRYFTGAVVREKGIIRPFRFGALELTDDDSAPHADERSIGEVVLEIYSVEQWKALDEDRAKLRPVKDDYRAHERSKKCLDHCVRLGEGQTLKTNPLFKAVGQKLLCTFVFNYRHMETLVAKGIVPLAKDGSEPKESVRLSGRGAEGARGGKRKVEELEGVETKREDFAKDFEDLVDSKTQILNDSSTAKSANEMDSRGGYSSKRVKREP